MKDYMIIFLTTLCALSFLSMLVGLSHNLDQGCKLTRIITKYNPGYRIGCYLSKERFRRVK